MKYKMKYKYEVQYEIYLYPVLNELVVQEAKKDERAVSTLHNTKTNHIKSIDMYIFASIILEKYNYQ